MKFLLLSNKMKHIIQEATKSQHVSNILDAIFSRPIFTVSTFTKDTQILNKNTANSILKKLVEKMFFN